MLFGTSRPLDVGSRVSAGRPLVVGIGLALAAVLPVEAQLTLTPAGNARGFALSTFASNFPSSSGIGPEGVAFAPDGTVLVTNYFNGNLQRFQNADNQNAAAVPVLASFGTDRANGLGYLGTTAYMSQYGSGQLVELNADGSVNRVVATGLANPLGVATSPSTGRIFVGLSTGIANVNPVTGVFSPLVSGSSVDGITLSPDGATLYAAVRGGINAQQLVGYSTSTGAVVYSSGVLTGGIDGTALGFGMFDGYIYANMNNGTVLELNLATPGAPPTIIASGGSRGDMVGFDPSGSGDMLITQQTSVVRLRGIPGPSTVSLLGLAGVLAFRRRR